MAQATLPANKLTIGTGILVVLVLYRKFAG
jgi:hypothetical protein